jgi:excisionase family DNA binding protein
MSDTEQGKAPELGPAPQASLAETPTLKSGGVTAVSSMLTDLTELSLHEAAKVLGVHYMTVYRYVRTGRLAATRVGGEWRVTKHALLQLNATGARGKPGRNPSGDRSWHVRFRNQLLAGDEAGSWNVVQDALSSGMTPSQFHLEVLGPTMAFFGSEWADGKLSIAREHRASAIAQRIMGRLGPQFVQRGRKQGHVILGAPAGDHHSLPVSIFADLLRSRNLRVSDLGSNLPARSFVEFIESTADVSVVGIGVTMLGNDEAIQKLIAELHSQQGIRVVLGGAAISSAGQAVSLGADAWSGAADAGLDVFAELAALEHIPGQRDLSHS